MRQHALLVQHALHQHFDFAAARLPAVNARRDHPRIVEHQQIAGIQLLQHVGKDPVRQLPARTVQRQQATTAALRLRIEGDKRFRQLKSKIGDTHG